MKSDTVKMMKSLGIGGWSTNTRLSRRGLCSTKQSDRNLKESWRLAANGIGEGEMGGLLGEEAISEQCDLKKLQTHIGAGNPNRSCIRKGKPWGAFMHEVVSQWKISRKRMKQSDLWLWQITLTVQWSEMGIRKINFEVISIAQ